MKLNGKERDLRHLLGHLRVLDTFCRCGSVTRAATSLHVTPGAVSQQLKQLEALLGMRLFIKSGRLLELSPVARQLALKLGEQFDRLEAVLAESLSKSEESRLRIVVSPDFAAKWLMPKLSTFYETHKDIDLDIATSGKREDLHVDNADFSLRYGDGLWEDVRAELLYMDELVPVCSPSIATSLTSPRDFLKHKWIHSSRRPDAWGVWSDVIGLSAQSPQRSIELANLSLCIEAAANGLGIALTQKAYLTSDLNDGRITPANRFSVATGAGIYLIYDSHSLDSSAVRRFKNWICGQADSQSTSKVL